MFFDYTYSDLKYTHGLSQGTVKSDPGKRSLYKILYIAGGEAIVTAPEQQTLCAAGDLIFFAQNQPFSFRSCSEVPVDYYAVYFTEFLVPADIMNIIRYCAGFRVADETIRAQFARFDWHLTHVEQDNLVEIKMLFRCVLTEILVYLSRAAEQQTAIPGMLNTNIQPVLDFITRNLHRPLQIHDICAEFHYSRSHLCQIFTQITGVPLMQYIRSARADYAEKLLRSGLPAMEVARQLGYSDYSSFYRMYRKHIGAPPSQTNSLE